MFSRFALGVAYLIFLLVVGLLVLGVHWMSGTVPAYTGSAQVQGISGTVDIDRDQYAIPNIHASTEHDAYFGLGYAEAQDRLFQMELERRLGEGRMAELFGNRSLPLDLWARTVGFSRIAEWMWQKSGAHTRDVLTAYCAGINAYLAQHRTHLGFEFDALGLAPEDWKPQDCLVIGRLMSWQMNFSALSDAAFGDLSLALDSAHLHSLFPYYPADGATVLGGANPDMFVSNYLASPAGSAMNRREEKNLKVPTVGSTSPPSIKVPSQPANPGKPTPTPGIKKPSLPKPPKRIGMTGRLHSEYRSLLAAATAFDSAVGASLGGGSNSFVVSPARTQSGAAILENDTHLQLGTPSRWYLAHLTSDDGLNVAGFLIPGLPVILSGRTPELAWGITSGMADECDYFIQKLDSTHTKYILPNGTAKPFQIVHDTILVRDTVRANDNSTVDPLRRVPINIAETADGPVMTGMHPDSLSRTFHEDPRAGGIPANSIFNRPLQPITLMWNGSFVQGDELSGWLALPHATTVAQARAGMANFATPCLNLCLADKSGNIAYQYIGRLPRRAGSDARLLLPRDGSDPAEMWQGFIYMRDLPGVADPHQGFIVSANNPPGGNLNYGLDWEPDSRADRISELLQTDPAKFTDTMAQTVQMDIVSPYDVKRVLPHLLDLFPTPNPPSIAPDSTWAFRLDSMRLYWKEDSLKNHTTITDSTMKLIRAQDSAWLAAHRPPSDTAKPLKLDPFTAQILLYLRNWDGGMRSNEIAPTIYSVFLNRLLFNLFRDQLGSERYAEFLNLGNIPLVLLANILQDSNNVWWDRPGLVPPHYVKDTSGITHEVPPSGAAVRDSIVLLSFRESLQILAVTFGPDIRTWQWGRLHTLTFHHPFDKAGKLIARLVDIPAGGMPGGPTTVVQGTYYLWNPYEMQVGPSMRMVTDMKDPVLYGVLPTGNSEAIFGDHYKDMLPFYRSGALIRISLVDAPEHPQRFELLAAGE